MTYTSSRLDRHIHRRHLVRQPTPHSMPECGHMAADLQFSRQFVVVWEFQTRRRRVSSWQHLRTVAVNPACRSQMIQLGVAHAGR
jgi:hypothetical protein